MFINQKGNEVKKENEPNTKVRCIFCGCEFSFGEKDIETLVENIPYDSGWKKLFGQVKDYIVHRYITCPWCKAKLKLRLIVDNIDSRRDEIGTTKH